jgi:hypothetical protein
VLASEPLTLDADTARELAAEQAPTVEDARPFPRVVRTGGETCVQTVDDQGAFHEDCRPEQGSWPRPTVTFAAPVPRLRRQLSRLVADLAVLSTLAVDNSDAVGAPGLGVHLALGGRLTEVVGLEGLADAEFAFRPSGLRVGVTLAPGLRLGRGSHLVVSAGPTLVFNHDTPLTGFSAAGTVLLHQVIFLEGTGRACLHLHAGLTLDGTRALFTFGLGFGSALF